MVQKRIRKCMVVLDCVVGFSCDEVLLFNLFYYIHAMQTWKVSIIFNRLVDVVCAFGVIWCEVKFPIYRTLPTGEGFHRIVCK